MWFIAVALVLGHAATVERAVVPPPVVRREVKGNVASNGPNVQSSPGENQRPSAAAVLATHREAPEAKRGPKVHITRIHPAEVQAWNFLEVDQIHRSVGAQEPPEEVDDGQDETDPSEADEEETGASSSGSRADEEIEEAQEPAGPADADDEENLNEELQLASLLSKPLGEQDENPSKMDENPSQMDEKPSKIEKGKNHKKLTEKTTSLGKKPVEPVAGKIQHKKGDKKLEKKDQRPNEDEHDNAEESVHKTRELENSTSTSETFGTSNESQLARDDTSQNHSQNYTEQNSALGQNSSETQLSDKAQHVGSDAEERNTTMQVRSTNESVIDGAEKELRKIQDALRNAEQRATKAEAELKAEKAWVANALSNQSGEDPVEHHQDAVEQKDVQRVRHEAALADLADVLMKLESHSDPPKHVQDEGKKEDDVEAVDAENRAETGELPKEQKHRKRRSMRHNKRKESEESEDDRDEADADAEEDVNSAIEESEEEVPQTQKHKQHTGHKHKSHKHKKGGFHVYVEADGGVLEH